MKTFLQRNYILVDREPVLEPDLLEWARKFGSCDRVVAQTEIEGGVISTVFLGLDHNWGAGPPLLFETMVFIDGESVLCERCSTWKQAEAQHAYILAQWRREAADRQKRK